MKNELREEGFFNGKTYVSIASGAQIMHINVNLEDTKSLLRTLLHVISELSPEKSKISSPEIDALVEFLHLPHEYKYLAFSLTGKRRALLALNMYRKMKPSRLNAIIYSLLDKKYLHRDIDGVITFAPSLASLREHVFNKKSFSLTVTLNAASNTAIDKIDSSKTVSAPTSS